MHTIKFLIALALATVISGTFCGITLADDTGTQPLFQTSLFGDDQFKSGLDQDITTASSGRSLSAADPSAVRAHDTSMDDELRRQMQEMARFLLRYGIRNENRFPGFATDERYSAQVQLQSILGSNPYEMNKPGFGEPWAEQPAPDSLDRIRIVPSTSLTTILADTWSNEAPPAWFAPPGTITAIGNGSGLFVVWGAGPNGKPIRNTTNGKVFIITGNANVVVPQQ